MPYINSRAGLVETLQRAFTGVQAINLREADLRGVDLSGIEFAFVSLELARFDEADLSSVQFKQVDLTNASFRGACLDRAMFRFVRAGAVNFTGLHAVDAHWDRSSLLGSNFSSADLKRSRFVSCGLERVLFDDADLTLGSLAWSSLDGATFRNTNLDQVETLGVSLAETDLSTACNFAYCREMVIEVLKRHTNRDLETMKWLGAITLLRQWCYPVWVQLLKDQPEYLAKASEIFEQYPASGCLEAFQEGSHPNLGEEAAGLAIAGK